MKIRMKMSNKTRNPKAILPLSLVFMGLLSIALLPRTALAVSATDNFNRADGPLGADWTDISDGGLAISSQVVVGTSHRGQRGIYAPARRTAAIIIPRSK